MKKLIHKINPPGLLKPNRGSVLSAIGTIFDLVKRDSEKAFNAHFPYLADTQKLLQHGKSLSIPRFAYDTDEEYRKRVATAAFYYTNAGSRAYTINQLGEHFGSRYTLIEEFLKVHVKVLDFSDEDKTWLKSFFDSTLDPNILIALTEWFEFTESVTLGDIPQVTAARKDRDVYPRGLRYDGRIKYDHGQEVRFDGSGTYNGSRNYNHIIPKEGTVSEFVKIDEQYNGVRTYGGEINYTGETEVWAPENIQNPATYGGGKDDDTLEVQAKQQLADKAELYPTLDGRLTYGGVITYGGTQPAMVDEVNVDITQRVALTDAVESTDENNIIKANKKDNDIYPSGLRYDGRIKYDHGIAPCYDGNNTYNGELEYKKVMSKKGTIIDSEHGDIPNPATYTSDSGEQDTLKAAGKLLLEDRVTVQPSYNGLRVYGGAINFGGDLPLANDDMKIKISRRHSYDGRQNYDGKIYAGTEEEVV